MFTITLTTRLSIQAQDRDIGASIHSGLFEEFRPHMEVLSLTSKSKTMNVALVVQNSLFEEVIPSLEVVSTSQHKRPAYLPVLSLLAKLLIPSFNSFRNCLVSRSSHNYSSKSPRLAFELELELIQTQMTQKPMLRAEVYARALRASQNRKEDSVSRSSHNYSSHTSRPPTGKPQPKLVIVPRRLQFQSAVMANAYIAMLKSQFFMSMSPSALPKKKQLITHFSFRGKKRPLQDSNLRMYYIMHFECIALTARPNGHGIDKKLQKLITIFEENYDTLRSKLQARR